MRVFWDEEASLLWSRETGYRFMEGILGEKEGED
jgi:hypothetical protein